MNTLPSLSSSFFANASDSSLSLDQVRERAPAVFASSAHECTSTRYGFIPTERVLAALMNVGFILVEARQTQTRRASPLHARHVVRLRRRTETVQLKDAIPELLFLNSHDGTSAYQLRVGIYRAVCTNGLVVSDGSFPAYSVSHRGNIIDEVITSALNLCEHFGGLADQVEHMRLRRLEKDEQIRFAERVLALRYPEPANSGLQPSQLLTCRRIEDTGDDLWSTLNKVQENLIRGGLSRRSITGRLTRTRGITAIRKGLKLNSGVWEVATEFLAA